ncbi:MAG: hypothetical protein WAN54_03395 [Syntrophobacteraceae bacterium]
MTVYDPVAVWPPTSVAVTVVPVVPVGTFNVQLNTPVEPAVKEPPVQLAIVTPSKTSPTALDAEKPVPDTAAVAPTGPWVGLLTVIAGVVSANVAVAVWPPTSPAVTVAPAVSLGTWNVQLNAPVALVVREPPVQVAMLTPSKSSPAVLNTEKPVPDTVTIAPTGPWTGLTVIAGVVTVKTLVAVGPLASVAVTVVPDAPDGTENVHVNVPVPLVVREPIVQVVIAWESNTSDASGVDTENPVPDTVTFVPNGPWVGPTVIVGVVTANAPAAVWPLGSVAMTVVPNVPPGTLNTQSNAPVALVVREPLAQLTTLTPSKTSFSALVTEKPVPDTVTVTPTGPWVGPTLIVGVVTVNAPVAVWPLASRAVTVVPDVPLGIRNVHVNAPVPLVVKEPFVQLVIAFASKTKDSSAVDTEKPVPETVTVAPTGPWAGVTAMLGTVTVNIVALVGVLVATSSPTTGYEPGARLETVNVQTKPPNESVVIVGPTKSQSDPPVGVSNDESNVSVAPDCRLNPEPVTVYEVPTRPWAGLTEIVGIVTVNVCAAVGEFVAESSAVTP